MDGWHTKQFVHHWRKKRIKTVYLLLAFVIFLGLSVFFLRQNNLKMVELRNQVVQADEQGGDIQGALTRLNEYVFRHMNTQIVRPVELVNTYNRQTQAIIETANLASGRDVYGEAAAACERRGVPLTSIAQCAADYALSNNPGVGPKEIILPDKALFQYSFASPRWTPDLAGLSLLITGVIGVWMVIRLIEYIAVRLVTRHRVRNGL